MSDNKEFKKDLEKLMKKHNVSLQIVQNIHVVDLPKEMPEELKEEREEVSKKADKK